MRYEFSANHFRERWNLFKELATMGKHKKLCYEDYRNIEAQIKNPNLSQVILKSNTTNECLCADIIFIKTDDSATKVVVSNISQDFFNIFWPIKEREEVKPMNMPTMKLDFGPITNGSITMSPYGLAVRTKDNTFLAYNRDNHHTVDVTGFTFDIKNMIYKLPAPVQAIGAGDMILHQGRPMIVTEVFGNISAIDLLNSEAKTVVPVSNIFGFNYITKIISIMNMDNMAPSTDHPFGNIFPMMMLSSMMNDDEGNDTTDFSKMMMMSMMMGGQNPFMTLFTPTNPQ